MKPKVCRFSYAKLTDFFINLKLTNCGHLKLYNYSEKLAAILPDEMFHANRAVGLLSLPIKILFFFWFPMKQCHINKSVTRDN